MAKAKFSLSTKNIINCVLFAAIGVLLLILRSRLDLFEIMLTVIGVLFIALGVYDVLINKDLIKGVVEGVLGVVIIICGWAIVDWVLFIFGILIAVKGVLDFLKAFKHGPMAWIMPIVEVLIGVCLMLTRVGELFSIMLLIAAIIFFINAVLALFGTSLGKR